MHECRDPADLHKRLNRISGQIAAVNRMIDEDAPCEDILIQINAIKSAVHKVGQIVIERHLKHCVRDAIEDGNADETLEEFSKVLKQFSKI